MKDLTDVIKENSRWEGKDAFPATKEWRLEINKWLQFIIDRGQFDRFLPRLKDKPEKRDEALAEITAAYYLSSIHGCKIVEWEPLGKNRKRGEFSFSVSNNSTIVFCEIKSPGWEADIAKQNKSSPRLKQRKLLKDPEFRWYDNAQDTRNTLLKASDQIPDNIPSLLIITDDFFMPNHEDDYIGIKKALFHKKQSHPDVDFTDSVPQGCFVDATFANISALAALNYDKPVFSNNIKYYWKIFKNPNSKLQIPHELMNMSE